MASLASHNPNPSDQAIKAVIYARFSSDAQREQSIEGQVRDIKKYALSNNYDIIDIYTDKAISGTTDNRPAFQKMIRDSASGRFQAVLVWKLDRFSREIADSFVYEKKLMQNGVSLVSINENTGEGDGADYYKAILYVANAKYSKDLRQKVSRGMKLNREKGLYCGGPVPFGYDVDKDKHFVINKDEAKVVREVFKSFVSTPITANALMKQLNSKGIACRGKKFYKTMIWKMLCNEKYIGNYVHGEERYEGVIPAIIDKETFEKAGKKLDGLRQFHTGKDHGERKRIQFLLLGKIFCGECGKALVARSGTSKSGAVSRYYACPHNNEKAPCSLRAVRKDVAESVVMDAIFALLNDEGLKTRIVNEILERQKQDNPEVEILTKELTEKKRMMDNLLNLVAAGRAYEQLLSKMDELQKEIDKAESALAKAERTYHPFTESEIRGYLSQCLKKKFNAGKEDLALIQSLVDSAHIYDDGKFIVIFKYSDIIDVFSNQEGVHGALLTVHHS